MQLPIHEAVLPFAPGRLSLMPQKRIVVRLVSDGFFRLTALRFSDHAEILLVERLDLWGRGETLLKRGGLHLASCLVKESALRELLFTPETVQPDQAIELSIQNVGLRYVDATVEAIGHFAACPSDYPRAPMGVDR